MARKDLIAIKKCGPNKPGAKFRATSVEARALVALKMAKHASQDYEMPVYSSGSDSFTVKQSEQIASVNKSEEKDVKDSGLLISEYVRDFAVQNWVDLNSIAGTGKDGRITKRDVESAIEARSNGQE
jgi:pyruvate/2-oxoglutarate dehydrogenase complex dihydrolipoamide acyltransferase (E2) component